MKYDVHDSEIMIHQRDSDVFLPLSLAEMQHVVDVMNGVIERPNNTSAPMPNFWHPEWGEDVEDEDDPLDDEGTPV